MTTTDDRTRGVTRMYRDDSKYKAHPRITWFGSGVVAYVDYVSATESYFIGPSDRDGFKVIPPSGAADNGERHGFATIDAGIEYALAQVTR